MKKLPLFFVLFLFAITTKSQETLPNLQLKDVNGKEIEISQLASSGKPIIISFWATWCGPCIHELEAINEVYEDWQKETGVKLIAVCIDDVRSQAKAIAVSKGKGWNYEILFDPNQELKRSLNIANVPYMLIYKSGKLVYKHSGYAPGNEDIIYTKIKL